VGGGADGNVTLACLQNLKALYHKKCNVDPRYKIDGPQLE